MKPLTAEQLREILERLDSEEGTFHHECADWCYSLLEHIDALQGEVITKLEGQIDKANELIETLYGSGCLQQDMDNAVRKYHGFRGES